MKSADPVREFLVRRGCAEHVVEGGLERLVANWERCVADIGRGYYGYLDNYLNDLDGRQILHELGAAILLPGPMMRRLVKADEEFVRLTLPVAGCLWGEKIREKFRWSASSNPWYFREPREPGPDLRKDLAER